MDEDVDERYQGQGQQLEVQQQGTLLHLPFAVVLLVLALPHPQPTRRRHHQAHQWRQSREEEAVLLQLAVDLCQPLLAAPRDRPRFQPVPSLVAPVWEVNTLMSKAPAMVQDEAFFPPPHQPRHLTLPCTMLIVFVPLNPIASLAQLLV